MIPFRLAVAGLSLKCIFSFLKNIFLLYRLINKKIGIATSQSIGKGSRIAITNAIPK
jgi:hypothetical protein